MKNYIFLVNKQREMQENENTSFDKIKEISKKDTIKYFVRYIITNPEEFLTKENWNELLSDPYYKDKLKELENSKTIIKCECNTYNGGLFSFAIHHNLLEEEFSEWFKIILFYE